MNWRKFERQLIKGGMFIILALAISLYFLAKQWMLTKSADVGPPTLSTMYYAHKAELILWYDKFAIPFVAPAFFYWFHKHIDSRYAKKKELANVEATVGTNPSSNN